MHHRFMWTSNVRASHGAQLVNLLKSRGIVRNFMLAKVMLHGHDQTYL